VLAAGAPRTEWPLWCGRDRFRRTDGEAEAEETAAPVMAERPKRHPPNPCRGRKHATEGGGDHVAAAATTVYSLRAAMSQGSP
jgi:hypothetical protein